VRSINRDAGCTLVVRPDQYVAHVLPLDGYQTLTEFFAGILVDATVASRRPANDTTPT
jgi:phenol 2-monooxygenase (NADPH)